MEKFYYSNNDDRNEKNRGVEYKIINGKFSLNIVRTGLRKKAEEILDIVPTIKVKKGIMDEGNSYTSKYGHGTVKGQLVRIEDRPDALIVVMNEYNNIISINNSTVFAYYTVWN